MDHYQQLWAAVQQVAPASQLEGPQLNVLLNSFRGKLLGLYQNKVRVTIPTIWSTSQLSRHCTRATLLVCSSALAHRRPDRWLPRLLHTLIVSAAAALPAFLNI